MRRSIAAVVFLFVAAAYAQTPETELVLVPVSVNDVRGINGSLWTTELWAVNPTADAMTIVPLPCLLAGAGCSEVVNVPRLRSLRLPAFGTADKPGVLLRAPLGVSYTLHVRDTSRQAESWGTEIPVVREKEFFVGATSATNIPFGPNFRHTLRIYSILTEVSGNFRVKLYGVTPTADDDLLRDLVVVLEPVPPPPPNRIGSPLAQAVVTELFSLENATGFDRVRVTIEPEDKPAMPYWAFVSVTNNTTQQVTTATPR